jgi:hypothetical protein
MAQLPPKPAGSCIEEIDDFDARTYRWKQPSGGVFRLVVAAFLIFWLCAWAVGWVFAFTELLKGGADGPHAFVLFWLGGWTIGGIFAFCALYLILRPSRPESVTLGRGAFRHDPGSVSLAAFCNPWYALRHLGSCSPFPKLFRRRKPVEILKHDLGPVVLERVGERQRLCFDVGVDRIEIGEHLREPEREWLAAVIEAWKAA